MTTKIIRCKCKHEGQDQLHGEGNRVANQCAKKGAVGNNKGYSCTVCSTIKASE